MSSIKLFEEKQPRSLWDAEQEKWYISMVDVIAALTNSSKPRKYWSVLKAEGSQLKMQSSDGKFYLI